MRWRAFGATLRPLKPDILAGTFILERSLAMCHGYDMRWWKSETTAKDKTRKADLVRTLAARQGEKAEVVSEDKVDEKELIPAE